MVSLFIHQVAVLLHHSYQLLVFVNTWSALQTLSGSNSFTVTAQVHPLTLVTPHWIHIFQLPTKQQPFIVTKLLSVKVQVQVVNPHPLVNWQLFVGTDTVTFQVHPFTDVTHWVFSQGTFTTIFPVLSFCTA